MTQKDLNKLHAAGKAIPGKVYLNEFGQKFKGTNSGRLEKFVETISENTIKKLIDDSIPSTATTITTTVTTVTNGGLQDNLMLMGG